MPDKIWKKKDYLLEKGKIDKIGRGRISTENHTFLEEAVKSGVKFSDYGPKVTVKTKVAGRVVEKTVRTVTESFPEYRSFDEYRYPEALYRLETTLKNVGMRNICQTCGYSFTDHRCDTPVLFDTPVEVVLK